MIEQSNFWYAGQLRKYLVQFTSLFYGLQVQTGIQACGVPTMGSVPVVSGSKDRVVAAIASGNTQNRMFALPIMAATITGLALSPSRRKAPDMEDSRTFMHVSGVFPDDLKTVKRVMPIPYDMTVELSIYASNTMQLHQILEQILVMFNPELDIQVSNGAMDWTRLSRVELTDIANEENYPAGPDRRVISWTLTFTVPIWIGTPMGLKDDIIKRIRIRLGTVNTDGTGGFTDEDGVWVPFNEVVAEFNITERPPEGPPNVIAKPL